MRTVQIKIILLALFSIITACKDDDPVIDQTIEVSILDEDGNAIDTALADGETILYLHATIPQEADETIREVTFNKSDGTFLGVSTATVTRPLDDENTAQIPLRVPIKVDALFFRATISYESVNYIDEAELVLNRAYANAMVVEPSAVVITAGSSITITAFLTRELGMVSEGTQANFKAYQLIDAMNIEVGRFTGLVNASTNENGVIMVNFLTDTNDINTDLPVVIEVSTRNDDNETIVNTFQLTINP